MGQALRSSISLQNRRPRNILASTKRRGSARTTFLRFAQQTHGTVATRAADIMSSYDHASVSKSEKVRWRSGENAGPSNAERQAWPKFTVDEITKHDSLKDGWIVVYDRVFDITTFAITHPGFHNAGQVSTALAITRNLGKDCTEEFVAIHSPNAWTQMHDFQIGVLFREGDDDTEVNILPSPPPKRRKSPNHPENSDSKYPVPRKHNRPTPTWLTNDRNFWSRYGGGVDESVLRYLEKQGYAQSAGGVEEVGQSLNRTSRSDSSLSLSEDSHAIVSLSTKDAQTKKMPLKGLVVKVVGSLKKLKALLL